MLSDTSIEKFKASLRGELIQRSDEHYEEARQLYDGMIDKRPLLIARGADLAYVIAAVRFGREHDRLTAIRGGHNGPGLGRCDDGLVIDLSLMKGVRGDPADRTVQVGPGCTQGDVDHAGDAFGLAVPAGIVSTTGIAGLTLGGGYVNFMMDEGEDRIRATYGHNYDRLVAMKTKYDPTNFFRVNQNIKPRG
jgi:FAD binding domain/Berberine and berberine like